MTNSIIVIGFAFSTSLGVIHCLDGVACRISFIGSSRVQYPIVARSRCLSAYDWTEMDEEALFSTLEKLRGTDEKVLIIPAHDKSCMLIDQIGNRLSDHYFVPNIRNRPGELSAFMDKFSQKLLAKKHGLPVAEGCEYGTDEAGFGRACQEVKYPCLAKPAASAFANSSKEAITPCRNQDELKEAFDNARYHGSEKVLVERFLSVEQELCAYGVAYNGVVCIPAYIAATSSGFGPHIGIAAEGEVRPSEELGDLKDHLESFVAESGLNGLFCIDLLKSDGVLYFSEMNLRAGASQYAVAMAGANLPAMLLKAYQGEVDFRADIHPVRYVNEKVLLDSYRGGHISWLEMMRSLNSKDVHFLKNDRDPGPWREFKKLLIKKTVATMILGPRD